MNYAVDTTMLKAAPTCEPLKDNAMFILGEMTEMNSENLCTAGRILSAIGEDIGNMEKPEGGSLMYMMELNRDLSRRVNSMLYQIAGRLGV